MTDLRRLASYQEQAFVDAVGIAAAVGQFSHVQLRNPTGSGVLIELHGVDLAANAAGPVTVYRNPAAALTTLIRSAQNAFGGKSPSSAEMRIQHDPGTIVSTGIASVEVAAMTTQSIRFPNPLIIPANAAIVVRADQANVALRVSFFFEEKG